MPSLDTLLDLLAQARSEHPDPALLARQASVIVSQVRPSPEAVVEAVWLGSAQVLCAVLDSPQLDLDARKTLATRGLAAWNDNPLQHRTSARILSALMERGANANRRTAQGDTIAERLGARLGTIEGNEARAFEQGRIKHPTIAGQILMECWVLLEQAGVDMSEPRRVRNMAMEPVGVPVGKQEVSIRGYDEPLAGLHLA